jgi:hypothetical protein
MALNSMVGAGLMPLGGLAAGLLAAAIGTQQALSAFGAMGLACVLTALWRADRLRALR